MKHFGFSSTSLFLILISLFIYSCSAMFGDRFEYISIGGICSKENCEVSSKTIEMQKDEEISLWAEFDFEFEGDLMVEYQLVIVVNQTDTLDMIPFDPFNANVTINVRHITVGNKHKYSGEAKIMDYVAEESGLHEFNVVIFANQKPDEFVFNKGGVVFRK